LNASRALFSLWPLVDYLRKVQPEALISAPDHVNLIAIWARLLAGVKTRTVITTHNTLSIVVRQSAKPQEKFYPILLRLFQRYATHLVAVSQGAAEDLARTAHIPRSRISVIYNPAVHSALRDLALQPNFHPWFADGHPPVILAAGRLIPQKDYPTLLRAFSILKGNRLIRLAILGEGKEQAVLGKLAADLGISSNLDFMGFDNNPYRYMTRCSVFVLSSAWEGFSIALAEALACGAQIVSTDCPNGPAEILDHGKYGRLVPVGDPAAMAEAIGAALDFPLPVDMLHKRAEAFSVDVAVEKYLGILGLS
jgi:glycosyltransferase involved in cell wall biosynthesis